MKECEVKILDVDVEDLENKLRALGAEKIFEGELTATFFDDEQETIRRAGSTLRLRQEGHRYVLTYKKALPGEAKVREELETEIADLATAKGILQALGYTPWFTIRKHRISYSLPGVKFEIDKHTDDYAHIPPFLEIEAEDEEIVFEWAEKLGYRRDDCKPWTILDLAKHY